MTPFEQFIYNQLTIYCVSFTLTYFLVVTLNLPWWALCVVFSFILWANQESFLYFTPLNDVQRILTSSTPFTIFGIAIFGFLNATMNISLSANRFGWKSAILLSVISVIASQVFYFTYHKVALPAYNHINGLNRK